MASQSSYGWYILRNPFCTNSHSIFSTIFLMLIDANLEWVLTRFQKGEQSLLDDLLSNISGEPFDVDRYVQSLDILLDAPSIFSICIVLWGHMRYCSVTIVVYRCNNVRRLLLYKNNSFIIMSQLWKLNYSRTGASFSISNINPSSRELNAPLVVI